MLLLHGLNSPFHDGVGGSSRSPLERSLRIADDALSAVGAQLRLPCDARGKPLAA